MGCSAHAGVPRHHHPQCLFLTVTKYVNAAHAYNRKAMRYNLVYGAWKDAAAYSVKEERYYIPPATIL